MDTDINIDTSQAYTDSSYLLFKAGSVIFGRNVYFKPTSYKRKTDRWKKGRKERVNE
jgi:hypothetical protein